MQMGFSLVAQLKQRNRKPLALFLCVICSVWILRQGYWEADDANLPANSSRIVTTDVTQRTTRRTTFEENLRTALEIIDTNLAKDKQSMVEYALQNNVSSLWESPDPLRIMLVTSWRSGSTFLGWILSNHSATFTTYEPLMPFAYQIPEEGQTAIQAVQDLDALLHCRMPPRYSNFLQKQLMMLSYNPGIWNACRSVDPKGSICKSPKFLQQSCQKFPIHVLKLVRLRVSQTRKFLEDPSLKGLKIIHLVRDPRGVMNSRWKLNWCKEPDCKSPEVVCQFMKSDLEAFDELSKTYGYRMMLVKYEDIAADPVGSIRNIFNFLGLHFTKEIENIIIERTSQDDPSSPLGTKKKAAERISLWQQILTDKDVTYIENSCQHVMGKLDYSFKSMQNETDKKISSEA